MSETARMLVPRQGLPVPALAGSAASLSAPSIAPSARLWEQVRAFRRRIKLVLLTLLLLNGVAFAVVKSVKPRYTAEATLLIGPRQEQVLDLKAVLAGLSGDSEAIESEVQVLRSRKLARAVVQELHLDNYPEFAAPVAGPGALSRAAANALAEARGRWNGLAQRFAPALTLPDPAPEPQAKLRDPVVQATEMFQRRLGIAARGHSRVISVTFDSDDPELAAAGANAVVNTYIADQLRAKRDATSSAHRWLEDRVAEMRQQVINADQEVASYRRRAAITQGRTGTLLSEQISTLGEQVVQARVARGSAEARLKAFQQHGTRPDSLPEVSASPTVQALRAQESVAQAQVAELSRTYGDSHPKVAAARAALGAIAARTGTETSRIAGTLADEARTAAAREAALAASLTKLRQEVDTGTDSEVELRALQHEAEANRALYDRLLARSRETNVEGGLQKPDAQVVSKADAPDLPSFPNPVLILPVFFIASCIATVLLVFAVEAIDSGFATLEQVEDRLGMPALGLLPRVKGARRLLGRLTGGAGEGRNSEAMRFTEALRGLHTSLMLSGPERPKVVLVTSALPGEGRSTVVLALARLMAGCGKRVVMVDCDLHRPDLHRACGVSMGPGLLDCLVEGIPVQDVLQVDRSSPALVVSAGSKGAGATDMFSSERMRRLLEELRERFDLVLLDSSPVLAVSETRNLCRVADTTMLVARWHHTACNTVAAGLRQILGAGGHVTGVVLSDVDMRRYARHSSAGAYQRRIGLYLSE